jgi:hypothetical protein
LLQGRAPLPKSATHQNFIDLGVSEHNFQEFLLILDSILEKYYENYYKELIILRTIDHLGFESLEDS